MKLIVGLGNPGSAYAGTRHNVGFAVVDGLGAGPDVGRFRDRFEADLAEMSRGVEKVLLAKPRTYMNLSGEPVSRLLAEHEASPADLVVVVDDVALPLGRLRVRERGSDGGHNGLRSLASSLGTYEFPRVRLGVGPEEPPRDDMAEPATEQGPQVLDLAEFVLGEFTAEEIPKLRQVIGLAADAVASLVQDGPAAAMNRFNGLRA